MTIAALVMMLCARVVGLRAPSSCCGSLWLPHRLSSLGSLLRTCFRWHSIPNGSAAPSSRKNKELHAACGADLAKKISFRESSIRIFPARRRTVAPLLRRRIQPPAGAVPSTQTKTMRRSVARGGACIRARRSRLSIAAPPLLHEKTRKS